MNKKRRLLMTAIPTQTLPVSIIHNTSPKKRPSPKNRKKSDIYLTQKAEVVNLFVICIYIFP